MATDDTGRAAVITGDIDMVTLNGTITDLPMGTITVTLLAEDDHRQTTHQWDGPHAMTTALAALSEAHQAGMTATVIITSTIRNPHPKGVD